MKDEEIPTFEEFSTFFPDEGDFKWDAMEAGDWHVYYCDDCDTWHKIAYSESYERVDGVTTIEAWSVDEDGDWDCYDSWVSDGPEDWESFYRLVYLTKSWDYFRGWRDYFDWMLEYPERGDPAGTFFGAFTPEDVQKSRDDMQKYMDM